MAKRVVRCEVAGGVPVGPGDAWEVIADAGRRPAWLVELRSVGRAPGRVQAGDRFAGVAHAMAHDLDGQSEVIASDPGTRLEEEIVVGIRVRSRWELAPGDQRDGGEVTSTVVRHVMEIDLPGGPVAVVLAPLLRWYVRRLQRRSLAALARESDPHLSKCAAPPAAPES